MTDPVDFLLRAAMRLPRPSIERLADGIITGLDTLDGDPDIEENGDELDEQGDERDTAVPEFVDQSLLHPPTGYQRGRAGTPEDEEDDDPLERVADA